jgi:hypothetical protein
MMARPLSRSYDPKNPFVVERHDQEDGSIHYEIWDERPDTYRRLCTVTEDYNDDSEDGSPDRGQSKKDADMIVTALNMVFGSREFKSAKLRAIPKR